MKTTIEIRYTSEEGEDKLYAWREMSNRQDVFAFFVGDFKDLEKITADVPEAKPYLKMYISEDTTNSP